MCVCACVCVCVCVYACMRVCILGYDHANSTMWYIWSASHPVPCTSSDIQKPSALKTEKIKLAF